MKIQTAPRKAPNGGTASIFATGAACGVACTLVLALLYGHSTHGLQPFSADEAAALPGADLPCEARCRLRPAANTTATSAAAAAAAAAAGEPLPPPVPLPDLDAVPHLMVSFGNAAYFELAHNWARSVRMLGAPHLIAAFDQATLDGCLRKGLPCQAVDLGADGNFRGDFAAFRFMGAVKVRFVLDLLERHPALPLVVVSDTDVVWLAQPWPYLSQRPAAEFFVSSDCLSHEVEERWQPAHGQPRCGHIPGNGDGYALNTGLFAVRNTPAARATLAAWAGTLVDPTQEHDSDPEHRGVDDQLALNNLFARGGIAAVDPERDPRTMLVFDQQLRAQALPVLLFSNGHVAFIQRTPWRLGVAPIAIHTTFQRFGIAGKRSRLREFGLWHMDPPQYYGGGASGGEGARDGGSEGGNGLGSGGGAPPLRLLAYGNDVHTVIAEAERRRYPGARMPLLEKHWVAMSYQLAAFRDALAAARMLGRTLIVPQTWCFCDYDEHPGILNRCRIKGTDYEVPFECPLEFLVPASLLDAHGVQYRHPNFLEHPQVPLSIRHSRALVTIAPARPAEPFPVPATTVGHGAVVWQGVERPDLERALQPVHSAAVLVLRGPVAGFLGGYGPQGAAQAADMDALFAALIAGEAEFCCFSWGDADEKYRSLQYKRPAPLSEPWRPWEPPQLPLPDWCDAVSDKYGNRGFTLLPQHPCAFLRNASAAAAAADDSGRYNREGQPG